MEGFLWFVLAVITFFVAYRNDFETGLSICVILGSIGEIIHCWNGMEGFLGKVLLIVMAPIMFAGFGMVPCAIASAVKFLRHRIKK